MTRYLVDLLPDITPTVLFWLAIPILGYLFYWLAPWLSAQPKKGSRL